MFGFRRQVHKHSAASQSPVNSVQDTDTATAILNCSPDARVMYNCPALGVTAQHRGYVLLVGSATVEAATATGPVMVSFPELSIVLEVDHMFIRLFTGDRSPDWVDINVAHGVVQHVDVYVDSKWHRWSCDTVREDTP